MKVCHVCLCGPVTDNFSYQENLLTKYQAKLGMDVSMIASPYYFTQEGPIAISDKKEYVNSDGVKLYRLKVKKGDYEDKFRRYDGLYETIERINPDVLFVHGVQFLDLTEVVKYKKRNDYVKMYVDNHADFSNSATNFLSRYILHGVIWKRYAKLAYKHAEKIYGVTPGRVRFLKEVYKLKDDKLGLLLMGADTDKVEEALNSNARKEIRTKYGIGEDDFLIMTGGKIDYAKKQTLLLMDAVSTLDNAKLIVFGSVEEDLKEEVLKRAHGNVQYIGWINAFDSYKYFSSADLVVFPGRHSVFWEQVLGLGIPMIVKYWEGNEHVDMGGNCLFLYEDNVEEIREKISLVLKDKEFYENMKIIAKEKGAKEFSYLEIAKKSVE